MDGRRLAAELRATLAASVARAYSQMLANACREVGVQPTVTVLARARRARVGAAIAAHNADPQVRHRVQRPCPGTWTRRSCSPVAANMIVDAGVARTPRAARPGVRAWRCPLWQRRCWRLDAERVPLAGRRAVVLGSPARGPPIATVPDSACHRSCHAHAADGVAPPRSAEVVVVAGGAARHSDSVDGAAGGGGRVGITTGAHRCAVAMRNGAEGAELSRAPSAVDGAAREPAAGYGLRGDVDAAVHEVAARVSPVPGGVARR